MIGDEEMGILILHNRYYYVIGWRKKNRQGLPGDYLLVKNKKGVKFYISKSSLSTIEGMLITKKEVTFFRKGGNAASNI
ncbi:MAG: hypothetical protein AB1478_02780 [Nitrospirota bacterium]